MSREIHTEFEGGFDWYGLFARAKDYKDKSGNYKTDYLCFYKDNFKEGDLIRIKRTQNEEEVICFHIEKVEELPDNYSNYVLLTGYWVWSVYAGTVKSIGDLPQDAHEGEYYFIKPSKTTTIKDYVFYERVGDEWKPIGKLLEVKL